MSTGYHDRVSMVVIPRSGFLHCNSLFREIQALKPQSFLRDSLFPIGLHLLNLLNFPNSVILWESNIEIHEPIGDISHSDHSKGLFLLDSKSYHEGPVIKTLYLSRKRRSSISIS